MNDKIGNNEKTLSDEFTMSNAIRHFSLLDLPEKIACYSPIDRKCPTTGGLQNAHTELLSLLLMDSVFRDFFNVYLLLPIHAHQCTVRQSNEGCFFQCFPLARGSGNRLSVDGMLKWLYSNRLPFFLSSRLYQLCLFTYAFCTNNRFLDFDDSVEYSKKQLALFGDLRTVEGIQKLIRYAGSSVDGAMIQLWLDLQWLRHTDKDHGHNDMMKTILDSYSSPENKLPAQFKTRLVDAVDETINKSLNSCLLTRRGNYLSSYDILLQNPFVNQGQEKNKTLVKSENDMLFKLQKDIMKVLKNDFCKRYLIYHNCLPNLLHLIEEDEHENKVEFDLSKEIERDEDGGHSNAKSAVVYPDDKSCSKTVPVIHEPNEMMNPNHQDKDGLLNASPDGHVDNDYLDVVIEVDDHDSCGSETEFLAAGRSKSTLPQISEKMVSTSEAQKRPKTCYPHLHPKITSHSRLSQKTSGYITMSSPEDRLASAFIHSTEQTNLKRSASVPNLYLNDLEPSEAENLKATSMINLTDSTFINVNQLALDRIRKLANFSKDGTESQLSNYSTSIDVSIDKNALSRLGHHSNRSSPDVRSLNATEIAVKNIDADELKSNKSSKEKVSISSSSKSGTSMGITDNESSTQSTTLSREKSIQRVTDKTQSKEKASKKDLQTLPSFSKKTLKLGHESPDQQSTVVLDKDMSIAIRRKTKYEDMMQRRKSSAFIRMSPSSFQKSSQVSNSDQEKRSISNQIIKDKTNDSMLLQDKGRFYVAIIASDQLAGGPLKNYLTINNNEQLVEYLNLWENIEIVRCLTNEGGRRGACAKSFGGNGFLSCHDEWPVKKDDPYYQYHESLRKIKKYQDSWHDFHLRFKLIQEFFSENRIVKPYDTSLLKKHAEQLTAAGCNDEILALVQDHLVTKLRKEVERYYKFDSGNFYYYMSGHDENFSLKKVEYSDKTGSFIASCHKRTRIFGRPRSSNLITEAIFSPLSRRLWVAIDICEKMVFPFAVRKLSLPLLTLNSMITMKMFIMRKRKEKEKEKEKMVVEKTTTGKNNRFKKKKKPKKLSAKKKRVPSVQIFFIDWVSKIEEQTRRNAEIYSELQNSSSKNLGSLVPPSIDDMFLQDPSIKNFRRFIIRKYKGSEKEHMMNVANFLIAQKELEDKMDLGDFSELSKGVCSNFIFCKNSILHDMHLPEKWLKIIGKKKASNPTFLLFMGAVVNEWLYANVWPSYISTMYRGTDIDYDSFYAARGVATWRRTRFNKIFCKRMSHFIWKISNFLDFLSVPSQFEEFREYLSKQKESSSTEDERRVKVYGKNLTINPNLLTQDLYLLIEIFAYKNLLLTSREVAKDLTLDGTEEQMLLDKLDLIVETFFDSIVPPRLQVNIPGPVAVDIMLSQKNLHIAYTLFNEVTSCLFQSLLFFWKKFCFSKHVPDSDKKAKIMKRMSGKIKPLPPSVRKRSNQVHVSCSDFDKFKFCKGTEIGGFNYSISHGYREIYRTKQLMSFPSSVQVSKTLKSIHSSRSNLSRMSLTKSRKQSVVEKPQKRTTVDLSLHKLRDRERLQSLMPTSARRAMSRLPRMSLPVIQSSSALTTP